MLQKLYRGIIPALILVLPAQFASAASFSLPSDAVIQIEEFTFPEAAANATEQNFPELLQGRLTNALQKAGFTTADSLSAPSGQENGLSKAPITESGEVKEQKTENADAATEAKPAEAPSGGTPGNETPTTANAEQTANPAAEQTPAESDQANVVQSVFASQATPAPAGYTLEGRVTLLRENLSAPLRIGGGVRIRAESVIHCTYRVKDSSGKTLISATASGSSARLTTAQNVDTALADLTGKVMTNVAEQIASRLSGVEIGSSSSPESGKDYYQDSPGKRLKKE